MLEWHEVKSNGSERTRESGEQTMPLPESARGRFDGVSNENLVTWVHAGIEHGLSQLLSEIFHLLDRTVGADEELRRAPGAWRLDALKGYSSEISANLSHSTNKGGDSHDLANRLIQNAQESGRETPTISVALIPREPETRQRRQALALTPSRQPAGRLGNDPESVLEELHGAFFAAMIITYAEGLSLLPVSDGLSFDIVQVIRSWKKSAPLRSTLLEDIAFAFQATLDLPNLLCDDDLSEKLMEHQEYLRRAVWRAHQSDLLTPAMLAALYYMDSRREAWWPINLVQIPTARRSMAQPD
jgi:6-phosphogluconate dehydrogenase